MFLNKTNIITFFTLILLIGKVNTHAVAQNLKADILSINKAYEKTINISIQTEINMYETYTSDKLYFSQKGKILKKGDKSFQSFEGSECVNTPEYAVFIDKENKEIVYAPKKTNFKEDDISFIMNLDSIYLLCKKYTFNKENHSYHFIMKDYYPNYREIILYFNPTNYMVSKIVFYCDEEDISTNNDEEKLAKTRVEMIYKYETLKATKEEEFTYQKYLTKNGNTFQLKPAFKNYNLNILSF